VAEKLIPAAVIGVLAILLAMRNWSASLKMVFVLVLIEGALRKWIVPGAADMVYFIKDVLLIGVYLGFWMYGPGNRRRSTPPDWLPAIGLKVCLIPIVILSFNPNIGSVAATILGARGYLFYLPIILVVPYIFNDKNQMLRQVAIYGLMAIPVCLLGVLQFKSDSFSVLNTYASGTLESGSSTFGGMDGQVRVTGTFSYLSGHVVFVCIFSALVVALIANPKTPYRRLLVFVALPLLAGNVFMSGSRAAFMATAMTVAGLLANRMGAITAIGKWRAAKSIALLSVGIVIIGGTVFREAIDAMQGRSSRVKDSLAIRMIEMPIEHISEAWQNGGIFGCGAGTTNPAVRVLRQRLNIPELEHHPGYYDLELGQIFAELGLTGFVAWYAFRLMILYLLWQAYKQCHDEELRVLILATFFLTVPFFLMSLVLNHVACVLLWGMTGLSLAAVRFSGPAQQTSVHQKRLPVRMKAA
jgi:hypothetical protein